MNIYLQHSIRFVVLLLLQVLLFNNFHFFSYINPYIYLIFFLELPVHFKTSYTMLLGFLMGFIIDIFANTMGIHTFSCVLLAFVRNAWIDVLFTRSDKKQWEITIGSVGWLDYTKYALGLIFLHHISLFLLEAFSFQFFGFTLLRALFNVAVTFLLILCYELCRKK